MSWVDFADDGSVEAEVHCQLNKTISWRFARSKTELNQNLLYSRICQTLIRSNAQVRAEGRNLPWSRMNPSKVKAFG